METEGETHREVHVTNRQTVERCSHKPRTPGATDGGGRMDSALEGVQPCDTLILKSSRFLLFQATWLVVLCYSNPRKLRHLPTLDSMTYILSA